MFSRQVQLAMAAAMCILSSSQNLVKGADITRNTLGLLDFKAELENKKLLQEFPLGPPDSGVKVRIYEQTQVSNLAKRDLQHDDKGRTIIDLTPSECTNQLCYEGAFQPPNKADCDAIVAAQLYNSTGSLRAFPATFVYVTTGTCAVVFQNPVATANYTLDYNWAKLGRNVQDIQNKCMNNQQKSIGGICEIKKYLNYTLDNVGISLQRIANS